MSSILPEKGLREFTRFYGLTLAYDEVSGVLLIEPIVYRPSAVFTHTEDYDELVHCVYINKC